MADPAARSGYGFCYNIGRVFAARGRSTSARSRQRALTTPSAIAYVALVPLAGLLLVPFIHETRARTLADYPGSRAD